MSVGRSEFNVVTGLNAALLFSNLMQSLSHLFTYQMFPIMQNELTFESLSLESLSQALITLIHPSLYKEHIWCSFVISSMNKKNAFNQKKRPVPLLSSCCLTGLRAQTLMWLLLRCFCFFLFSPLGCVSCSFYSANLSREQTACC